MTHLLRGFRAALLTAACTGLAMAPALAADRVELRDGSVLFGTFKDADGGKITLETAYAGTLEIDQAEVVAMQVESALTLQMDDGRVLQTQGLAVSAEQLALSAQTGERYALADLTRTNPEPWELGQGYRWTGVASGSLVSQRGNTDTDDLDYRIESAWRSLKDRYRFELFGELSEASGAKNAENWTSRLRYDRLQTGDWYWGGALSLEQDKFADLNLRTTLGPYVGRKFFTEPVFELEVDGGVSYIKEDFITAEDRDYLGATWNVDARSNWLGGDSQLYFTQKGILNLEQLDNLVLSSLLGVSFPLLGNIEGAAEIVWDLNTGAPKGTEKLDETYRFRVGYRW